MKIIPGDRAWENLLRGNVYSRWNTAPQNPGFATTANGRLTSGIFVAEYGVTYEGCVLATREVNGYDDSDFVALCWDETEQKVVRVTYATTRCWTYSTTRTRMGTSTGSNS